MPKDTKRCPKCGEVLPIGRFSPGAGWCKLCTCQRAKDKYRNDPVFREARKAYHREDERRKRADPEWNGRVLAKMRERRATDAAYRITLCERVRNNRRKLIGRALGLQAIRRAKRDGRECDITPSHVQEMIDANPSCVYCGVVLQSCEGHHTSISPTLDRKDSSRGYTTDNVALACFRCNTLKRDATLDELKALVANMERVISESA